MEIYTLSLRLPLYSRLVGNDEWERVIEISAGASLSILHSFIREIADFDDDHCYMFFAGRSPTNRKIIFSEETGTPCSSGNYGNVSLNEIYPLNGLKLYYLYDFGDKWLFEIRRIRKKKVAQEGIMYPRILESTGRNPDQYNEWSC